MLRIGFARLCMALHKPLESGNSLWIRLISSIIVTFFVIWSLTTFQVIDLRLVMAYLWIIAKTSSILSSSSFSSFDGSVGLREVSEKRFPQPGMCSISKCDGSAFCLKLRSRLLVISPRVHSPKILVNGL